MKCKCGGQSSVLDSRIVDGTVRRRRKCSVCDQRWTTYERESWTNVAARIVDLQAENTNLKQRLAAIGEILSGKET